MQLLLMAAAAAGDKGGWWNLAELLLLLLHYSFHSVSFKSDGDIFTFGDEIRR